ncbi:ThuA domain-containing protein [Luedemannella helvata]|uniref:ThuA-like domain-containing protein n=1 Tax=Luedemannella helvata TaxID=349315 RepID=A0ABN2K071_9ACTN
MASPRVLVFSRTTGYRHESIPAGVAALRRVATRAGFAVDATEDPSVFTGADLRTYQAMVFLQTTGPVLDAAARDAVAGFITGGGGFLGVHAAILAEPDWPFYRDLLGAEFTGHPEVQAGVVDVRTRDHPATAGLPPRWERVDEWYDFAARPTGVRTLLAADEASYAGATMGEPHPLAWCHDRLGGRMFYTALGHTVEAYSEPLFLEHLSGALGYVTFEGPTPGPQT